MIQTELIFLLKCICLPMEIKMVKRIESLKCRLLPGWLFSVFIWGGCIFCWVPWSGDSTRLSKRRIWSATHDFIWLVRKRPDAHRSGKKIWSPKNMKKRKEKEDSVGGSRSNYQKLNSAQDISISLSLFSIFFRGSLLNYQASRVYTVRLVPHLLQPDTQKER